MVTIPRIKRTRAFKCSCGSEFYAITTRKKHSCNKCKGIAVEVRRIRRGAPTINYTVNRCPTCGNRI